MANMLENFGPDFFSEDDNSLNDFKAYIQMTDAGEAQFVELFKQAAIVVQRLGQLYTDRCFYNN